MFFWVASPLNRGQYFSRKRAPMSTHAHPPGAAHAPNLFVESKGRQLAYRTVGTGQPLLLCVRFRGTMDDWDPAFLDALAAQGLRVITFDYSGLGLSTGKKDYSPLALAADANDLMDALALENVVIGGWSLGGLAAQVVLAMYAARLSHGVLIGTGPPGAIVKPAEQLFYETARHPENDFEDMVVLFFEPKSAASRAAAARSAQRIALRQEGRSPAVPWEWAAEHLGDGPREVPFPAEPVLQALKTTRIPILHIGGDHDIIFPVENWYALNGQCPTLQLHTFPRSGHGPQHEHPEAAAQLIGTFVRHSTS
jgi:pimeloyl-ACP methyl ester carboxylesterase